MTVDAPLRPLNLREQRFVDALIADPSCTQMDAAIRAGYAIRSARSIGSELAARPHIAAALETARAAMAKVAQIDGADVLRRWLAVVNADPNALVAHRRTCCRFCHGTEFRYQRTPNELRKARAEWETLPEGTRKPFDEEGGSGYDRRKPPHPDCPECFGEGTAEVFIADTRALKGDAALLYAGMKETKDGIEVKMQDRDAALVNVAKHLGMFVERHEVKLPPGSGVLAVPVPVTDEQWTAGAAAQQAALAGRTARPESGS